MHWVWWNWPLSGMSWVGLGELNPVANIAISSFHGIVRDQLWGFSASANNDIMHDVLQGAAIPCGLSSPSRRIEIGTRNHADLLVLRKTSEERHALRGDACGVQAERRRDGHN